MEAKQLLLRCMLVPGFGRAAAHTLLERLSLIERHAKEPAAIAVLSELDARQTKKFVENYNRPDIVAEFERHVAKDDYFTLLDSCYPDRLQEMFDPPIVLFYRGNLQLLYSKSIGIVGSRFATDYAAQFLHQFMPHFIDSRLTVISGLAAGVDTAAHRFCMENVGETIAIIGTGLDCYYPLQNRELQDEIGKHGLLLSEYPDKVHADRYHFPERNRIIAGLSHGVLVVEAKKHSGSLITANLALQANREVFAVPGHLTASTSTGCNALIQAGATPVLRPKDVISQLHYYD